MKLTDLSIAWLNSAMAMLAVGAHVWAATVVPLRRDRLYYQSIALLALSYAIAYAVLALGWADLETWSPLMRGVSLIAWPLVWVAPAFMSVRRWRERLEASEFILAEAQRIVKDAPLLGPVELAARVDAVQHPGKKHRLRR